MRNTDQVFGTVSTEEQQNYTRARQFNKNCTLLVPELFKSFSVSDVIKEYQGNQFKDLELFLARSKGSQQDNNSYEAVLFDLFDIPLSDEDDLPIAPVTYLGDTGMSVTNWCLRADPVHLMPDRDELVLSGPETLSLTMVEAEHLAAELNNLFKQDGWRIEVAAPTRWYLHVPEKPQIRTWNLSQVSGHPVGRFLPEGQQAKQWHRVMNEVQMILHASEVNRGRQANGQRTISSLWFWGGGQLPGFGHSRWSQVWSDETLSKGLAKLTRTPCSSLPKNTHDWLSAVGAPGEHLLVYPELSRQGMFNDSVTWEKALLTFQQEWLTPLLEALKKKQIGQLTVNSCGGQSFRLTKARLKFWWLRRKPLSDYRKQS